MVAGYYPAFGHQNKAKIVFAKQPGYNAAHPNHADSGQVNCDARFS